MGFEKAMYRTTDNKAEPKQNSPTMTISRTKLIHPEKYNIKANVRC